MHCTSVEINKFLNHFLSHHLSGIELQYTEKFMMNSPCTGKKGHNISAIYDLPLSYTARILGRKKESVRLAQERLHALGILTVDGKTWEEYRRTDGRRRCTGYTQVVALSGRFKDLMRSYLRDKKQALWGFQFGEGFLEKQKERKRKAQEAKKRFLEGLAKVEKVMTKTVKEGLRRGIRRANASGNVRAKIEDVMNGLVMDGYASSYERSLFIVKDLLSIC